MRAYVRTRQPGSDIPQWIAQGFWYLDGFVRDWSSHANFPREHDPMYYQAAFARLHDLAHYLFFGESPYQDAAHFDARAAGFG